MSDLLTETRVGPQTLSVAVQTDAGHKQQFPEAGSQTVSTVARWETQGWHWGTSGRDAELPAQGLERGAGRARSWERSLQGRGLGHRGQEDLW